MAVKLIYLIRHAQPDYPGGTVMCLGQKIDLPLSAAGLAQAQKLARAFEDVPLEAVYASPLLRAKQTAQAIRPSVQILEDLTELDGGEWDGLTFDQLHERYPQYFGSGVRASCPPGGETDAQGLARAYAALAHIAARTHRCAAAVAHSGLNRILLCDLLGKPLLQKKQVPQDYAAVNVLEWDDGNLRVRAVNLRPEEIAF